MHWSNAGPHDIQWRGGRGGIGGVVAGGWKLWRLFRGGLGAIDHHCGHDADGSYTSRSANYRSVNDHGVARHSVDD